MIPPPLSTPVVGYDGLFLPEEGDGDDTPPLSTPGLGYDGFVPLLGKLCKLD